MDTVTGSTTTGAAIMRIATTMAITTIVNPAITHGRLRRRGTPPAGAAARLILSLEISVSAMLFPESSVPKTQGNDIN